MAKLNAGVAGGGRPLESLRVEDWQWGSPQEVYGMDECAEPGELEVWRAERAITRVIQCYARGVDQRDFTRVRSCFHADARVYYGDWFRGDLDEAMDFLAQAIPRLQSTLHVFGTPWIELDLAAGTADCESYAINSATYPPEPDGRVVENVSGTRYLDRFDCRDGRWAIVERRNQRVWAHNVAQGGEPARPQGT